MLPFQSCPLPWNYHAYGGRVKCFFTLHVLRGPVPREMMLCLRHELQREGPSQPTSIVPRAARLWLPVGHDPMDLPVYAQLWKYVCTLCACTVPKALLLPPQPFFSKLPRVGGGSRKSGQPGGSLSLLCLSVSVHGPSSIEVFALVLLFNEPLYVVGHVFVLEVDSLLCLCKRTLWRKWEKMWGWLPDPSLTWAVWEGPLGNLFLWYFQLIFQIPRGLVGRQALSDYSSAWTRPKDLPVCGANHIVKGNVNDVSEIRVALSPGRSREPWDSLDPWPKHQWGIYH